MTPFIGQKVTYTSLFGDEQCAGFIKSVDYVKQKVCIYDEQHKATAIREFADIRPQNNYLNFLHLIDEWDEDYPQAVDPSVYEIGKDLQLQLQKMYKALAFKDKHRIEKIVQIRELSR